MPLLNRARLRTTRKTTFCWGAGGVGGAHQFRGPAEFCPCSRRGDLGDRFSSSHERSGIGREPRTRFDRHRLARQHGLIDQNGAFQKARVRRDDSAERELHDVPHHKLSRGNRRPDAVPVDGGREREP